MSRRTHLMMIGIITVALGTSLGAGKAAAEPSVQSTEDEKVVASVETLFRGLGKGDATLVDAELAPGFYLYDAGVRFDGDSILQVVQKLRSAGTTFAWSVTAPDVHVNGDSAWIAYVDKGTKTDASGTLKMEWLESANLVKRNGRWQLAFMHSTPVAAQPAAAQAGQGAPSK